MKKRRYFEIWGDLAAENRTLKLAMFASLSIVLIQAVFLFMTSNKPPLVIRVSEIGKAEPVTDYPVSNAVSEVEVINFSKEFISRYMEYNSYSIEKDIAAALNMMTARFQEKAKKDLIDSKLLTEITRSNIKTQIKVKEVEIEKETEEIIFVSVFGLKKFMSYEVDEFIKEKLFRCDLVVRKTPRSMSRPYGLLVEDCGEIVIKEINKEE